MWEEIYIGRKNEMGAGSAEKQYVIQSQNPDPKKKS
jgi:hypothetical protein